MNELNQMNLGFVAGLGLPTGLPQNSIEKGDDGFQDLLSLLGDSHLADENSGAVSEILDQAIAKVEPSALELLQNKNLAMNDINRDAILAPESLTVGQQKKSVETKDSLKDEVSLSSGFEKFSPALVSQPILQSQTPVLSPEQAKVSRPSGLKSLVASAPPPVDSMDLPNLRAESVEAWGVALASGDIKKVEVGQLPEAKVPIPELTADNFGTKDAQTATPPKFSTVQIAQVPNVEGAHAVKLEGFKWDDKVKESSQHPNLVVAQSEASAEKPAQRKEKSLSLNRTEAMKASDFVLGQMNPEKAASETGPALIEPSKIGEPSDRRVSAEALNFVAGKVDALKAQGGGTLRVQMSPKELGGLEIKVSLKKGGLDVQVLAERPETLSVLKGSESELSEKLQNIAPTRLDLSASLAKQNVNGAEQGRSQPSGQSSQDLVMMKDPQALTTAAPSKNSMQPSGLQDLSSSASSLNSSSNSKNSSLNNDYRVEGRQATATINEGWNRDERRERARDRWEEFFEGMKKSA